MLTLDAPPRYCSFLLRCWEERGDREQAGGCWRFSLEDPHTGRRHGFATLPELVVFIEAELTALWARERTQQEG